MKKIITFMLLLTLCLPMAGVPAFATENSEKLQVLTTIFAPYDFMRQIAGDRAEISMLLSPGAESHSFEPTPQDIIKIQNSDVFVHVGGENDIWVDRILESMDTSEMTILKLVDLVEAVPEEIVEGMEHDHDHEHAHEIDPEHIADRALTDWAGAWKSLEPMLSGSALDPYLEMRAEEAEMTLEEAREQLKGAWQSEIASFEIEGNTLSASGETAAYLPEGYTLVEDDHDSAVWYQYRRAEGSESLPEYLLFNDHGTGEPEHEEAHDEAAHEEEHEAHGEAVPHTHLRYGNEGFAALLAQEDWSPFFVAEAATDEAVLGTLTGHSHEEEEHAELDEHVWTSPKNAITITNAFAQTLGELDPENAAYYAENAKAYIAELTALDETFTQVVADGNRKLLIFGDRFPFRYLADAYGLDYYAAFSGCSTDTEASAQTIVFLIDKTAEEEVPVVFTIELSNGKIADAICESTGAKKLEMHSAHNVTKQDFEAGITYLDIMRRNAEVLKEALQ